MGEEMCVMIIISLIIGFILGRWKIKNYCGEVIISPKADTCTFALDIPTEDICLYRELVFRVTEKNVE